MPTKIPKNCSTYWILFNVKVYYGLTYTWATGNEDREERK